MKGENTKAPYKEVFPLGNNRRPQLLKSFKDCTKHPGRLVENKSAFAGELAVWSNRSLPSFQFQWFMCDLFNCYHLLQIYKRMLLFFKKKSKFKSPLISSSFCRHHPSEHWHINFLTYLQPHFYLPGYKKYICQAAGYNEEPHPTAHWKQVLVN